MVSYATFAFRFLLCNGEPPCNGLPPAGPSRMSSVYRADGGANAARRMGLVPDVIIGDLDSVSAATRRRSGRSLIIRVARQDNTDMEKALDFCAGQDCRRVHWRASPADGWT